MKNLRGIFEKLMVLGFAAVVSTVSAADYRGTVAVTRNNARQITGATLNAGPNEYQIVLDENGKSLAEMYEHKELKITGSLSGNQITAETWEEIKSASAPEPAYNEPEPREEEPQEEVEESEPKEEPSEEASESDDEPKDEPADEPADESEPKDEDSSGEESGED